MPRTKEFSREEALDRAMDLFWRKGYEATSMQDLVEEMGINRGSLYETFGSKHDLFLSALDRYYDKVVCAEMAPLERAEKPLEGIRDFFRGALGHLKGEMGRRGCLIVNSVVELGPHCDQTTCCSRRLLEAMEAKFERVLERAKQEGALRKNQDPSALARYLVGFLVGLCVMAKARPQAHALKDFLDEGLKVLE